MTEPTNSQWSEVASRVDALALKLKLHLEQSGTGEVPQALNRLRDAVNEAFDAAGNAVRDEGVRADVRDVGRLLADAFSNTFAKASSEIKAAYRDLH
jgi:hypothetical protein